ncbi:segregation/condensation protein A [Streptomyces sp. NPDC060028]|uniref:segregation and condensation protein A n=1 Tax=Streptomyces sp. NPDC060028 TaxID=3347041 RepID=UPI00369507AF
MAAGETPGPPDVPAARRVAGPGVAEGAGPAQGSGGAGDGGETPGAPGGPAARRVAGAGAGRGAGLAVGEGSPSPAEFAARAVGGEAWRGPGGQEAGGRAVWALRGDPVGPGALAGPEALPSPVPGLEGSPARGPGREGSHRPGTALGGRPVSETAGGAGGDGRFRLRLANFEGPFDLLLQLISRHKLDVTEVALSKVTDEFMAHIRAMGPDWDLDQTTEFLVVAATLLDLKAARLLPAAEVEDEADLALLEARDLLFARLLQYRAYKQVAEIFEARAEAEGRRYPRTVGLEPHHAELLPEVVIGIGAEGFARLAVKAMQPRAKPQVYVDHIHAPLVSVREQAGLVVAVLKARGEATFQELIEDAGDTLTVVARFLALLELYREKAVVLDQEDALQTLTVRWSGGDGDGMPTVTDEFDRIVEVKE